jgi:hypothetical protein
MSTLWQVDILTKNGGSTVASDVPFHSLRCTKTVDGPGSIEVELREPHIASYWQASTHRIQLTGPMNFTGYLENLHRQGGPEDGVTWTASGLGLESILDWRIVRHQQNYVDDLASNIVFGLLDEAQDQYNGNLNFSHGTVHNGPTDRFDEGYCFGSIIGDSIRDLSTKGNGFDWAINASGELVIWNGNRGSDSGETLDKADVRDFEVQWEGANLVTTVSAVGSAADPYGPVHDMVRDVNAADTFGRREIVIDVNADQDTRGRLVRQAKTALKSQRGATLTARATWYKEHGPGWGVNTVGLQDKVHVLLGDHFGGDTDMRVSEISIELEPETPDENYIEEFTLTARITDADIDDTDPDD